MRRRIVISCVAIAILFIGGAAWYVAGKRLVIELDQSEIQKALEARFPVEKRMPLGLALTLSNPRVTLRKGSDRVGVAFDAVVNFRLPSEQKQLGGSAEVNTGLQYDPDDYSFYLSTPVVEQLVVQGIPVEHVDLVTKTALALTEERLKNTRVYTLNSTKYKQAALRLILKGFVITNGKLIVTLGL